ncbi:hypothetical protein N9937_01800 [bacterium]|nr:hypothetical protein [bacterium]
MTIQDKGNRIQEVATAGQTVFTFPFEIFSEADMKVFLTPVGQDPDPAGDKLPPSAYVITLNTILPSDGFVTLNTPATLGDTITLESDTAIERTTDFATAGAFRAAEINLQLDKLTRMIQQNETLLKERGLTYQVTDILSTADDNTIPKLEVGQVWIKNSANKLVGAAINGGDVNTLRDELVSETALAPGSGIVGHYSIATSSGITVETQLNQNEAAINVLDTFKTDLGSQTMVAPGSGLVGHYNLETAAATTVKDQLDENTSAIGKANLVIPGVVTGLTMINNGALPLKDLDISPGTVADATLDKYLTLPLLMTKKLDVAWAAGSGNGGLFDGAIAASTTYHVYIIENSDLTIDAGFDTTYPPANIPAGYTKYARVGSIITSAGSDIVPFTQFGNRFIWKTPAQITNGASFPTNTKITVQAPTPPANDNHKGILTFGVHAASAGGSMIFYVSNDFVTLPPPTGSSYDLEVEDNDGVFPALKTELILDATNKYQVEVKINAGTFEWHSISWGYIDKREGDTH